MVKEVRVVTHPQENGSNSEPLILGRLYLIVVAVHRLLRDPGVVDPTDQFLNPLVGKCEGVVHVLKSLLSPVVHGLFGCQCAY